MIYKQNKSSLVGIILLYIYAFIKYVSKLDLNHNEVEINFLIRWMDMNMLKWQDR
jgi:hypothetical protein